MNDVNTHTQVHMYNIHLRVAKALIHDTIWLHMIYKL